MSHPEMDLVDLKQRDLDSMGELVAVRIKLDGVFAERDMVNWVRWLAGNDYIVISNEFI